MNTVGLFQYFVVAGLINTSLFAFLLLTRKKHTIVSVILIVFMLLVSFQALLNAFDTRSFFMTFPHLSRISWLLPTLFGPLIYLFTFYLTSKASRFRRVDLLHFIPFCLYLVLLWGWYVKPATEKRALLDDFEALSLYDFGWMNQFSIPWTLAYLLLSLRQLRWYRRELADTHSEISLYQFQWLRQFIYIVLAILVITALGFYGTKWGIPFISGFYHYSYAIIVVVLYWMAYKSLTQPALFNLEGRRVAMRDRPAVEVASLAAAGIAEKEGGAMAGGVEVPVAAVPEPTVSAGGKEAVVPADAHDGDGRAGRKYAKSGLDAAATDQLLARLLDYMEQQKPYLEPELTIYALAAALDTNRHHLSQVINERQGMSFFDFVNGYRVRAVQAMLASPAVQQQSILGIAYDCGFNSKATFNSSFKKHTGMTPSSYLKSLPQ